MAVVRRTLNLGSPATTIGRPPQSAPQSRADILGGDMPSSSNAAWVGRAAALEGTPTVESGNVLEALAAALEGGIRGRAAYGEYNREQGASQRAQALAQQQADREYKGEIQDRDLRARALEQQANPAPRFEGGAGFTNAYRINPDGTVTLGGALPLRPQAPRGGMQQHPDVPEGFELE